MLDLELKMQQEPYGAVLLLMSVNRSELIKEQKKRGKKGRKMMKSKMTKGMLR